MASGEGYEEFEGRRFWGDEWIEALMLGGNFAHILLFEWVWTGPMRTPSGLLRCPIDAVRSMGHFTKLSPKRFRDVVEEATEQPHAGLAWFPEREYWWVKNYISHRREVPNKLVASAKDLLRHPRDLASLAISYNLERGINLMEREVLSQFAVANEGFPYPSDTLRERFAIDINTYLKPTATPEAVSVSRIRKPQLQAPPKAPPGWNECKATYSDGFLATTGERPKMDEVDFKRLKVCLKGYGDEWPKLKTVIEYAVSGKDTAWDGGLPSLQTILSKHHLNRITSKLAIGAKR